jgi:hypothetical protein
MDDGGLMDGASLRKISAQASRIGIVASFVETYRIPTTLAYIVSFSLDCPDFDVMFEKGYLYCSMHGPMQIKEPGYRYYQLVAEESMKVLGAYERLGFGISV